ncbi:hypothetical protein [Embleya sp. NPDC005575]|uniref:hypothetical protein n=1 Tax=Embleya sp. NPDC005575 TaxID=3156892 RepID=UPI0033ADD194
MSEPSPPHRTPDPPIRHPNRSLRLGLFSLSGFVCCLTSFLAPIAGFAGVLFGITAVDQSRRQCVGKARALLGLICSVAACVLWIWLLGFTDQHP